MLNMDFTQPIVIETVNIPWINSPADGVGRKLLGRENPESGHTTSIVRFAAGSHFPRHEHPLGEEILVLDFVLSGTFKDEHGSYPAGTWLRSPHLSSHYPYVDEETIIWVKTGHLPVTT